MIDINVNEVASNYLFLPLNSFKGNFSPIIPEVENLIIKPRLSLFFKNISKKPEDLDYLLYNDVFSDVEFKDKEFSYNNKSFVQYYIYEVLFKGIGKSKFSKVEYKPKYCITFDKDLVDSNLGYGTLKLGAIPVLYFVYIDFQEVFTELKKFKL